MGYKPKRKTYLLVFDDADLDGLEVEVTSVPLGNFIDMSTMADLAQESGGADAVKATVDLFEAFARALVAWNVEDDKDQPVPTTIDGLKTLDVEFVMYLIQSWMTAIGGVSAPLGDASTAGETSLTSGIDMQVN